jgi:hypothetical protein
MPDEEIARRTARSPQAVQIRRASLGIHGYYRKRGRRKSDG